MNKPIAGIAFAALGLAAPSAGAQTRLVSWDALASEGTRILSGYLRINTTNPPGPKRNLGID